MENSGRTPIKLLELLSTLDRKEFNGFGRYILQSVKDKKVYTLFSELKKYFPQFAIDEKGKIKIYKKIFPNHPYNNREINYLLSATSLHLEEYLIKLLIKNDQAQRDFMLMVYFKKRKNYKLFEQTSNNILSDIEALQVFDSEYYFTKMKIEYDLYHYSITDNDRVARQTALVNNMIQNLDEFYMYNKLSLSSDLAAFGKSYQIDKGGNTLFLHEIKAIIQEYPLYENTLVQIYLFILNNFEHNSLNSFLSLRDKIFSVIDNLNKRSQQNLFSCLVNYAISCSNNQVPGFRPYFFETSRLAIDKEYSIDDDGILNYTLFLNLIVLSTSVDILEIDWAKRTIKEKAKLLHKNIREDCLTLARSYVYLAENNFEAVIQSLSSVNWQHHVFALQARITLLKSYYELADVNYNHWESFNRLSSTFYSYMKRSTTFSSDTVQSVLNFIAFISKLDKNKERPKKTVEQMLAELNDIKFLAARQWLIDKTKTHLKRNRA